MGLQDQGFLKVWGFRIRAFWLQDQGFGPVRHMQDICKAADNFSVALSAFINGPRDFEKDLGMQHNATSGLHRHNSDTSSFRFGLGAVGPFKVGNPGLDMGSSLNSVPFLGPQYSTKPLYKKDPKRGPNLENYPTDGHGHSRNLEALGHKQACCKSFGKPTFCIKCAQTPYARKSQHPENPNPDPEP